MIKPAKLLFLIILNFFVISNISFSSDLENLPDLVEELSLSVVRIETTSIKQKNIGVTGDPFFDEFFKRQFGENSQPRKSKGLGSGFVYSSEGYIVTNYHVVEKATDISVVLSDGSKHEAEVIGTDTRTDLALLRIKPKNELSQVRIGDSELLRIGQWVIAIGNPLGFGATVTTGIISAKSRYIDGLGTYVDFLQTDAALNKGNSGGPLFNIKGEVVGVNTAIAAKGQGIGFAIPISMASDVIEQLKINGKVERGWLGVVIQKITPELADSLKLSNTKGAIVTEVVAEGPAFKAGLKRGDIILFINDKEILKMEDLPREVGKIKPGVTARLVILRDLKKINLDVKLATIPNSLISKVGTSSKAVDKFGFIVNEIPSPSSSNERSIIISKVFRDSNAHTILMKGDIILEINNKSIENIKSFEQAIASIKKDQNCVFFIKRQRKNSTLSLFKSIVSN